MRVCLHWHTDHTVKLVEEIWLQHIGIADYFEWLLVQAFSDISSPGIINLI